MIKIIVNDKSKEKITHNGYDIIYNDYGVEIRKNGRYIGEAATDEEAIKYIDNLDNVSYKKLKEKKPLNLYKVFYVKNEDDKTSNIDVKAYSEEQARTYTKKLLGRECYGYPHDVILLKENVTKDSLPLEFNIEKTINEAYKEYLNCVKNSEKGKIEYTDKYYDLLHKLSNFSKMNEREIMMVFNEWENNNISLKDTKVISSEHTHNANDRYKITGMYKRLNNIFTKFTRLQSPETAQQTVNKFKELDKEALDLEKTLTENGDIRDLGELRAQIKYYIDFIKRDYWEVKDSKQNIDKIILRKKQNEYGEYKIEVFINGTKSEEAAYYTDDWQDAMITYFNMVKQYGLTNKNKNNIYVADSSKDLNSEIYTYLFSNDIYNKEDLKFAKKYDLQFISKREEGVELKGKLENLKNYARNYLGENINKNLLKKGE